MKGMVSDPICTTRFCTRRAVVHMKLPPGIVTCIISVEDGSDGKLLAISHQLEANQPDCEQLSRQSYPTTPIPSPRIWSSSPFTIRRRYGGQSAFALPFFALSHHVSRAVCMVSNAANKLCEEWADHISQEDMIMTLIARLLGLEESILAA